MAFVALCLIFLAKDFWLAIKTLFKPFKNKNK
jgi:hypothetical protein